MARAQAQSFMTGAGQRLGALLLVLLLAAGPAMALEVREVRWGFDGLVVPERVNLLSVLLDNDSGAPWEEGLVLYKTDELGGRLGARQVEACFVAPYASRWVQFYPYVGQEGERWVLTAGNKTWEPPRPRLAPPARVLLTDPTSPVPPRAGLKTFPDNLFPTTVSATDGLDSVVLDHAPAWEPSRRQAFLDWLHRGGTVHLLRGEGGGYPRFPAELSALNEPSGRFHVGAGLVVRHDADRGAIGDAFFGAGGFPVRELQVEQGGGPWKFEDGVFGELADLVRPRHNWALIYLALVCYAVLIVPVAYIVGRARKDFRAVLLVFIGSVVSASVLLSYLGRRGYQESAAVHSLSYARPVTGQYWDVTQWCHAFAVRGDYYTITHPGDHNIYSTCQDFEPVNGIIQNGLEGRFMVDIPPYSGRSFLHRGKAKAPDLGLRVARCEVENGRLRSLSLGVGPAFPEQPILIWALHRAEFYSLSRTGEGLSLSAERGVPLAEFLSAKAASIGAPGMWPMAERRRAERPPEDAFGEMLKPLIARSLGGAEGWRYRIGLPPRADDCLELFILADSPDSLHLSGVGLGRERGCVLYHVTLFAQGGIE